MSTTTASNRTRYPVGATDSDNENDDAAAAMAERKRLLLERKRKREAAEQQDEQEEEEEAPAAAAADEEEEEEGGEEEEEEEEDEAPKKKYKVPAAASSTKVMTVATGGKLVMEPKSTKSAPKPTLKQTTIPTTPVKTKANGNAAAAASAAPAKKTKKMEVVEVIEPESGADDDGATSAAAASKPSRSRTTPNKTLGNLLIAFMKKLDKFTASTFDLDSQVELDQLQTFWNENHVMITLATGLMQRPIKFGPSGDPANAETAFHVHAAFHMFELHAHRVHEACLAVVERARLAAKARAAAAKE